LAVGAKLALSRRQTNGVGPSAAALRRVQNISSKASKTSKSRRASGVSYNLCEALTFPPCRPPARKARPKTNQRWNTRPTLEYQETSNARGGQPKPRRPRLTNTKDGGAVPADVERGEKNERRGTQNNKPTPDETYRRAWATARARLRRSIMENLPSFSAGDRHVHNSERSELTLCLWGVRLRFQSTSEAWRRKS
jgi:hypothetical protein